MWVGAIITASDGSVYLVKQRFSNDWELPGGAVKRNETIADALRRILLKNYKININAAVLILHGVFLDRKYSNRNYVAVFVVRDLHLGKSVGPDSGVSEEGFFPTDHLPANTTIAVRSRLAEVFDGRPIDEKW